MASSAGPARATYHIPDEILGDEPAVSRCSAAADSWDIQPRPTLAGSLAPFRGAAPAAPTAASERFAPAPARRPRPSARRADSPAPPRSPAPWRPSRRERRSSPPCRRPAASMRRSACRSIRSDWRSRTSARVSAPAATSRCSLVEGALVNLRGEEIAAAGSAHRACAPPTGAKSTSGRRDRPRTGSPPASAFLRGPLAAPPPGGVERWSNSSRRAIRIPSPRRDEGS